LKAIKLILGIASFCLCTAFTCGKSKEKPGDLVSKAEPVTTSPLADEFRPSIQIKEKFEIHVGGCGDNPDVIDDFNHYTAQNHKVAEKYGLNVQVVKDSARCGYTLHKGSEKLDLEWTDFDPFWKQFKAFYGITE
jgi:hypothetical protein